jgi:epsin
LEDHYNGGGGGGSSSFRDDAGRKGYDEYDAGEYEETPASRRSNSLRGPSSPSTSRAPAPGGSVSSSEAKTKAKEKEKEKPVAVDDLLGDWGDDSGPAASSTTTSIHNKALPALVPPVTNDGATSPFFVRNCPQKIFFTGDDFDDFQSAPVSPAPAPLAFSQTPMQASAQGNSKPNLFDILNQSTPSAATSAAPVASRAPTQQQSWPQSPLQAQTARPNYMGGGSMGGMGSTPMSPVPSSFTGGSGALSPTPASASSPRPPPGSAHPTAKSASNFDDLWSLGLGASAKAGAGSSGNVTAGKSIKDLEREKAQAGIWGASQGTANQASVGAFGAFGNSNAGGSSGGGDDLLL